MSFTFPNPFKPLPQPVAPQQMRPRNIELPAFDHPNEIEVLPFDKATGELAQRALFMYGVEVSEERFGATDTEQAQRRVNQLAGKMAELGWFTHEALDSRAGEEAVNKQIDTLWKEQAPKGEDAQLILGSLEELASSPEVGYYADRAADVLSNLDSHHTRIALK